MSEKPISGARVAREMLSRSPAWFTMHRAELERAGFPKALPVLNAYYPPAVRRAIADMDIHVDFASPDCYEIDTKVPYTLQEVATATKYEVGTVRRKLKACGIQTVGKGRGLRLTSSAYHELIEALTCSSSSRLGAQRQPLLHGPRDRRREGGRVLDPGNRQGPR
jgi:hypothetical protein